MSLLKLIPEDVILMKLLTCVNRLLSREFIKALVLEGVTIRFSETDYWKDLMVKMCGEDILMEIEYDLFHEVNESEMDYGWIYCVLALACDKKDQLSDLEKFEYLSYTRGVGELNLSTCHNCKVKPLSETITPKSDALAGIRSNSVEPKLSCRDLSCLILTAYNIHEELVVKASNFTRKAVDLIMNKVNSQSELGLDIMAMMGLLFGVCRTKESEERSITCGSITFMSLIAPRKETYNFRKYITEGKEDVLLEDHPKVKEMLDKNPSANIECNIL